MAAAAVPAATPVSTPTVSATVPAASPLTSATPAEESALAHLKYVLVGMLFGVVFVKAEIISWFRMQEMFRFEAFHMYGVIGSAVVVGAASLFLIRRLGLRTLRGEPILIAPKPFQRGQVYGGLLFGLGWALTGACPGPLFAQVGAGYAAVGVTVLSALAGTWTYGALRDRLPH